ncbi:DUF3696 domain-containing protein [Chloroflexota bacterium]
MLTRICLENFKSWENLDLELGNITLLFGTNSSGKTSALDALLLLKQTAMGFDWRLPLNFGGETQDYKDFGNFDALVFNHDSSKHVGIKFEWTPVYKGVWSANIDTLTYSAIWREMNDKVVLASLEYGTVDNSISDVEVRLAHKEKEFYGIEFPVADWHTKNPISIYNGYDIQFHNMEGYVQTFGITMYSREFGGILQSIAYLGPLREHPKRVYQWRGAEPSEIGLKGEKTIDALLYAARNSKEAGNVLVEVAHWLKQMGLVEQFSIESIGGDTNFYEAKARIAPDQPLSSLADVGFGVSQVLPVLTLLFMAPEGSIILLEQPEIHLHPSAQASLADLFLYVAEQRNLQLIIESHSEYLLRRLQRRIAEAEQTFATPEHIKMYFSKIAEGKSVLDPVDIDKYGQIANWPENFFGDVTGDLHAMTDAALQRRRQELQADD